MPCLLPTKNWIYSASFFLTSSKHLVKCKKSREGGPCARSELWAHVKKQPSRPTEAHFVGVQVQAEHKVQSGFAICHDTDENAMDHQGPYLLECAEVLLKLYRGEGCRFAGRVLLIFWRANFDSSTFVKC